MDYVDDKKHNRTRANGYTVTFFSFNGAVYGALFSPIVKIIQFIHIPLISSN